MTPTRARQLATRWFVAFTAVFIARHVLLLIGIDLLDLPLQIAELLLFAALWKRYGWIDGYRAARLAADTHERRTR